MRAAVITGKRTIELIDVEVQTPVKQEVVVDISFCGICGTDIQAYRKGGPYPPAVCGHEWSGVISEIGNDVRNLSHGDRVVIGVPPPCGVCPNCLAGQTVACDRVLSFTSGRESPKTKHGGFAERLTVHKDRVIKTDPRLSDETAAQVEPATITLHAVRKSGLRLGDIAVIQGAGPIGLLTLQWALSGGASTTVVVEPNAERRQLAQHLGATYTSVPGTDAKQLVTEISNGVGADIVFECAGKPEAIQSAVDIVRRSGSICLIGVSSEPAQITPALWVMKELKLTAALGYCHEEFEMAMSQIGDGRIKVAEIHTLTTSLHGIESAFIDLADSTSTQSKVLVRPSWDDQ